MLILWFFDRSSGVRYWGFVLLNRKFEPEELVIEVESVDPNQWYWLELSELDEGVGTTNLLHGNWIWM